MVKKVCVYIDGANFFGCLNNFNNYYFDTNFDFDNYIKSILGNDEIICVYYYNGYLKKKINANVWKRQDVLFKRLNNLEKWKVILCRKQRCKDDNGKTFFRLKEDDINLAVNALSDTYEEKFDKMILISSDRDFIPLIRQIKKRRKDIEIYYFEDSASKKLLNLFRDKDKKKITKSIVKKYFLKNH